MKEEQEETNYLMKEEQEETNDLIEEEEERGRKEEHSGGMRG